MRWPSDTSEDFSSFKGPMHSFFVNESIDRTNGILRRWVVISSGKRSTLVKYLKAKWLWDELNAREARLFWIMPEILSDLTMYLCLKAFALGTSKKDLRSRLEFSPFQELKFISRQQYLSIKGRLNCFFKQETVSLRRTPKYSGYTKHYKDKGTLGSRRDEFVSEVTEPVSNVNESLILEYLTVGEISLFGGVVLHPEEAQKGRNGKNPTPKSNGKKITPSRC